jgi:2-polyprenyl-6-methoxyphenol hydroxylase-like FAD-dependent oxidoreductase
VVSPAPKGSMSMVSRVLVVGGGITGSLLSIALAQQGVDVDLVEIAPVWEGSGHGITVQGNALKALRSVGVLDEVLAQGVPFNELRLRQADGSLIAAVPTPHTGGEDLPATMGSLRSSLQAVLCRTAYATGVHVTLDTTVTAFDEHPDSVSVTFSDGRTDSYDLVVGADGIRSKVRDMIGIPEKPKSVGMGIWRVVADRPAEMECAEVYYGGPHFKAGYSPISDDLCYAYMLDDVLTRAEVGNTPTAAQLIERSEGYGGTWGKIRASLDPARPVNYQWIESVLVPDPWYRGRVIVVGDAAHACPPLIAQGAAMCSEDAVVLAEVLGAEPDLDVALKSFMARRLPRVQLVVENSMQLVEWEIHPDTPGADPARVMSESLGALMAPA